MENLKVPGGAKIAVMTLLAATAGVAAAIMLTPQRASALPAYAQQTGLACGRCHVNPAGGGARNAFGNKFQANGHKLPGKK